MTTFKKARLLIPAILLLLCTAGCFKRHKSAPPPPVVEVADVIQKDVPVYIEWVASMDGSTNATIRAQVTGYLISQNYNEGDFVRKGQALFEIDPRPFQASLEQAEGVLANQQAVWDTAKANLKRILPLAERNAVSQKDRDDAVGAEASSRAAVLSAQAAVDNAKLQLSFTKITSPIDGIAGISPLGIGDLVGPSQQGNLATVSTVDPIKVYIPLSEQQYLYAARLRNDKERKAVLTLILADGSTYPQKGRFVLADRQVDPNTGTIRVASLFPNPGNVLRPGQFARVRAHVETKDGALLVPQRAVTELQGSYQVAVVGADNKIDIRPVTVSEREGTLWVVDTGLKPGERVVVEGTQKVKSGEAVNPQPFVFDKK